MAVIIVVSDDMHIISSDVIEVFLPSLYMHAKSSVAKQTNIDREKEAVKVFTDAEKSALQTVQCYRRAHHNNTVPQDDKDAETQADCPSPDNVGGAFQLEVLGGEDHNGTAKEEGAASL